MFDVYISKEQLETRILELSKEIRKDYQDEEIVLLCILKGSIMFCADLMRQLSAPIELEFLTASSYSGTESSGLVDLKLNFTRSLKDKNVLIVEDIVDTGLTIKETMRYLQKLGPKSLKLVSLLSKPSRREHEVNIDYLGFEIEDQFVIGYGLDLDQKYRELPYIGLYKS